MSCTWRYSLKINNFRHNEINMICKSIFEKNIYDFFIQGICKFLKIYSFVRLLNWSIFHRPPSIDMISLTTSVHGVEDLNVTKGQLLLEHPAYLRLASFVCRLGGNGWASTVTTEGLSNRITQNQIPSGLKVCQTELPKIKCYQMFNVALNGSVLFRVCLIMTLAT